MWAPSRSHSLQSKCSKHRAPCTQNTASVGFLLSAFLPSPWSLSRAQEGGPIPAGSVMQATPDAHTENIKVSSCCPSTTLPLHSSDPWLGVPLTCTMVQHWHKVPGCARYTEEPADSSPPRQLTPANKVSYHKGFLARGWVW